MPNLLKLTLEWPIFLSNCETSHLKIIIFPVFKIRKKPILYQWGLNITNAWQLFSIISKKQGSYLFPEVLFCTFPAAWQRWPPAWPWPPGSPSEPPTCPSCWGRTGRSSRPSGRWRSFGCLEDLKLCYLLDTYHWKCRTLNLFQCPIFYNTVPLVKMYKETLHRILICTLW